MTGTARAALLPWADELPETPAPRLDRPTLPDAPRPRLEVAGEWRIEPHLCLACFGRVLSRGDVPSEIEYRCSNCGVTGVGQVARPPGHRGGRPERFPPICACNARYGPRDAGLRCVANENRGITSPGEIVLREM